MLSTALTCGLTALTALSSIAAASPVAKRQRQFKFDFNGDKVRGVNLGGWFVLEPWITPSIFENQPANVVDEYTLCQTLGPDSCHGLLDNHWKTWITEDDFAQIAAAKLNFVRIPIGYWSINPNPGDPYVKGAYDYLGKALDWAQGQNLKVMIDLHGAPGSQNGFDNSGHLGPINFGQGDSISQFRKVLQQVRDDHANHPAVATIEVVNEPMANTIGPDTVRQLYMDTWGDFSSSPIVTTIHDGFLGVNAWNDFGAGMDGVMVDTHHYEIFDNGQLQMNPTQHNQAACAFGQQMATNNLWTISGEWTGAQTDCAKWLNGRGIGARYDGTYSKPNDYSSPIGSCDGKYTGTVAGLSNDDKNNIKNFVNAQLDAYEMRSGWIFWTWKTESAPEWDMQDLLANGLFPNPVTSRNADAFRC